MDSCTTQQVGQLWSKQNHRWRDFFTWKWPPEAQNPPKFSAARPICGLRPIGRKKLRSDSGERAPKTSIFFGKMRKSYFLAGGTPKNDDLLRKTAAQIATLHTATWCQTRTPRGGVWVCCVFDEWCEILASRFRKCAGYRCRVLRFVYGFLYISLLLYIYIYINVQ